MEYNTAEAFDAKATVDAQGVVRWLSNDSVPPGDILLAWARLGLPFDHEASKAAADRETRAIIAQYRNMRLQRGYTDEERAAMRAAFGPNEVVVDVLTGKQVDL